MKYLSVSLRKIEDKILGRWETNGVGAKTSNSRGSKNENGGTWPQPNRGGNGWRRKNWYGNIPRNDSHEFINLYVFPATFQHSGWQRIHSVHMRTIRTFESKKTFHKIFVYYRNFFQTFYRGYAPSHELNKSRVWRGQGITFASNFEYENSCRGLMMKNLWLFW